MSSFITQSKRETDVLIVGGGGAGAMTAIRAKENGVDPLVVVKGPFPSGSSVMARSGFAAAMAYTDPRDSPELHAKDMVGVGTVNDPELALVMCREMISVVNDMDRWGVDLVRDESGKFALKLVRHSAYPRDMGYFDTTGKAVMSCLARRARDLGIEVLHSSMLVDLIVDDGVVVGAVVLNYSDSELIEIRAKSIVIAAGGAGQIFPHSDTPRYQTGDATAAAWRAGGSVIDIEFPEFQLSCCGPGFVGFPPASSMWITNGARLYNALHERFMKKYGPDIEKQTRSGINRAISLEVYEGRGTEHGGVYLDISHLNREQAMAISPTIFEHFAKGGVDLEWQPMEVACGCHSFLGGIRIDPDSSTDVPGLFAAGEAAGGVNGADRLGGNALSNALAFGSVAGKKAAAVAKSQALSNGHPGALERVKDQIEGVLSGKGAVAPITVISKIKKAMAGAQVVRSAESLNSALRLLNEISEGELSQIRASGETKRERLEAVVRTLEAQNMALVGKLVATAALIREESRGFHYRMDFPQQNDVNWRKSIVLYPEGEEIAHRFIQRPAV